MTNRSRKRSPVDYAEKFPALARRRPPPSVARIHDFTSIMIGHDPNNHPVFIDDTVRARHCHCIGLTGSGKTTALKNMALADFRRGRGGIIIDPHGSHPGSLYNELTVELHQDGFFETGRVHFIDPNIRSHIVPINFLARIENTDISVISDALLQGVERAWGDEDTHAKPTIRTILKATFMTLAELGLPLTDAKLLFDPHDRSGYRARAITKLSNEYARDEMERLHATALDERSKRDFRAEVVGPINRINEFVSSDAIRALCGVVDEPNRPRRTLDLLDIMNKGDIVLVNLSHGEAVSEADTDLLGALLLRYIFLLASRRKNREFFSVMIDEAHRYMTGDVPNILAELRKYGVGVTLAHQFLAQIGNPGDLLYEACMNSTEIKLVFRIKSPDEAQRLAEMVLPLNLERPVAASIRPTVIGHRRSLVSSRARRTSEAESEGTAETIGETHSRTETHSYGKATGTSATTSEASGQFSTVGDSRGMVLTPTATLLGPNAKNAAFTPTPMSQSVGDNTGRGTTQQSTSSTSTSNVETENHGSSEGFAQSRSDTTSRSRSRATSRQEGEAETFEAIYADLAGSFHSLESERYRAGELLRALPIGQAFVNFNNKTVLVRIPAPKRQS